MLCRKHLPAHMTTTRTLPLMSINRSSTGAPFKHRHVSFCRQKQQPEFSIPKIVIFCKLLHFRFYSAEAATLFDLDLRTPLSKSRSITLAPRFTEFELLEAKSNSFCHYSSLPRSLCVSILQYAQASCRLWPMSWVQA